tara:strand:- start:82 stop:522 length:441 start_codon:yes stop_codon:yes gene_type:complete
MNESFITRSIKNFLKKENYYIIQCIPPRGQGGIHFKVKNKPMYPDIIAFKNETMIIGESKPKYSESDHLKLNKLLSSDKLFEKAQYILNNYFFSKKISIRGIKKIKMFLAFEKSNLVPTDKIVFFNVDKNGNVEVLESQDSILKNY